MSMPQFSENEKVWESGFKTARCLRVVNETRDVKTFWFALAGNEPLKFKPGQFLNFTFRIEGKEVYRCYSISSSPTQPYQFGITIKQVPGGLVSNWLHENLVLGDEVAISPPAGHFNCIDVQAEKYLLLSGGSGITPNMSIIRWMKETGQTKDVHFMHSARSPEDIIFEDELQQIDAQWENFQLSILCENKSPKRGWSGYKGRLTSALLECMCPDYNERVIMCCGPAPYMQAVRKTLEMLNFPMENYYEESFGSPMLASAELTLVETDVADSVSVQLSFSTSNKQVISDSNTTVLDSAQANGVWIQAGCRTGICGSCKVLKTSGSVMMDDPVGLSESELDEGYILACCSYPKEDLSIQA